ncbi:heavy-metal-associated domain-containing protein [Methylobacterium komagatae]|jgi:copper chaperone CopZ|uniref:Heavy-metal-associated domain-containing protein n=1 Tax=Methylobacterium komagatae TaxID=374425 RepID=A0ABW2BNI8_9HYPH|nr:MULTISPECIES: heavy-metal-associated domain-containing protein [Methylobacterium]MDE3747866.1 heavy-metal-associated domain-containing protein [Methylobacterium radiotolerans]PVZ05211.1 copper chaperone CopZ [Methylobacterium organophilum]
MTDPLRQGAVAALALAATFGSVGRSWAVEDQPAMSRRVSELKVATIPIEGMACLSCAASIKRTVRKVDGVSDAEIDFVRRSLRVTYASGRALLLSRVKTAIDVLGYKAGTPVLER